jgi:hypothetical protein
MEEKMLAHNYEKRTEEFQLIKRDYEKILLNGGNIKAWTESIDGVMDLGTPNPAMVRRDRSAYDVLMAVINLVAKDE